MKSTKNDSRLEASMGEMSSRGDRPDRESGGHVYAANLIMSPTSCDTTTKTKKNTKKHAHTHERCRGEIMLR